MFTFPSRYPTPTGGLNTALHYGRLIMERRIWMKTRIGEESMGINRAGINALHQSNEFSDDRTPREEKSGEMMWSCRKMEVNSQELTNCGGVQGTQKLVRTIGSSRLISNFRHSFTLNLTNNRSKRVKKECGQTGSFSAKERREVKRSREKEREGKRERKRGREWSDRSWRWNRPWMETNEEMKGKTNMLLSRIWRDYKNALLNGSLLHLLFHFVRHLSYSSSYLCTFWKKWWNNIRDWITHFNDVTSIRFFSHPHVENDREKFREDLEKEKREVKTIEKGRDTHKHNMESSLNGPTVKGYDHPISPGRLSLSFIETTLAVLHSFCWIVRSSLLFSVQTTYH